MIGGKATAREECDHKWKNGVIGQPFVTCLDCGRKLTTEEMRTEPPATQHTEGESR